MRTFTSTSLPSDCGWYPLLAKRNSFWRRRGELGDLRSAKRIIIVGPPGSGKSTLGIKLGTLLDLPVCHLDALYWRPGWVAPGEEEFDAQLRAVVETDSWIIDGNYSRTLEIRLKRAEAAIMLDFPRSLCLYRVLRRRLLYAGRALPDMAADCPEKVDWSFIRWIWDYPGRSRQRVIAALDDFGRTSTFVHLQRPRDASKLLGQLRADPLARVD